MTTEAVFLDLDDTLYPYDPCNAAGKRAAFETFGDLGYDLSREAFDDLYMAARRETKRELRGTASAHERFLYFKRALRLHAGTHDANEALALGDAYWHSYIRAMSPFEGVEETLRALRDAGLTVAIVTNLTTRIQLEKLAALGVDEHVDYVLTSEETGREKPSAIMFTTPLSAFDLRPSEAVMVGDSVVADVEGGNAAGLETVLFNADPDRQLEGYERPDHRIDAFRELTEVVL
ncbi:HAD family hydrolase [Halorubrum gandharaense]